MFEVRDYRHNRSRSKSSKLARARYPVIFRRNSSCSKLSKLARARVPVIFQCNRPCLKSNEECEVTVRNILARTCTSRQFDENEGIISVSVVHFQSEIAVCWNRSKTAIMVCDTIGSENGAALHCIRSVHEIIVRDNRSDAAISVRCNR